MAAGATLSGRYVLVEPIAQGGMGEIWRADDQVLGRTVAVKILLPVFATDPELTTRFHAEARTMAALHHPAIVDVYDYGRHDDLAFLVMPYVEGESLRQRLQRVGPLPPAEVMTILAQAARALQAAHDRGVVHRDVKPGNLLLSPDGRVLLTDFGIARLAASAGLTDAKSIIGTAAYLAPEQVTKGAVGAATDVYALGVVAYECLTGRRPFAADTPVAIAMMHTRDAPPPLPDRVPAAVRSVVMRALAKAPAKRWPSAAAMAQALTEAGSAAGHTAALGPGETSITAPVVTATMPTVAATRTVPARAKIAWAAAAGLLLITGIALVALRGSPAAPTTVPGHGPSPTSSQQPVGVSAGGDQGGDRGGSHSGRGRDGSGGGSSDGSNRGPGSGGSSGDGPGGPSGQSVTTDSGSGDGGAPSTTTDAATLSRRPGAA